MPTTEAVTTVEGSGEAANHVDRFTYSGNDFPWWLLVIWVGFICFMTYYSIRYLVPNLTTWVEKPPYHKFVP